MRQLGESEHPRYEPLSLNHTLVSDRQLAGEHRSPDFDRLRSEFSAWQTYYLDPGTAMRGPQEVLGLAPPPDPGKCERHLYKQLLRQTIRAARQPILTSEMEYAPDLVAAMDLFRAGKNQPSLKHFVEEIRTALQQLR